ncbi:DNA-dependent metalloprotease WSS1-like isoform X2 [Diospyros lotus]|uniref:DNA-dependent metalloprotease WSS1-like isoform X2 n=1 Tax=Diospyros lotus TaxID=55363 RepID=UPI0022588554|nr:DNA-dependent metalloprotease WSS1-like isoform X2 [Diospyros lotus]
MNAKIIEKASTGVNNGKMGFPIISVLLNKRFSIHMDLNDLNKVWEIKTLSKHREGEAREILQNIAKQVQPIMRKRKWKVKILSEFCPTNPSLLGLNIGGGTEVKLRLRMPNNELNFLPYNQILDTMLHELCHNDHAPHNTQFYNLLDEIRKECEELMAKGITGTGRGFDLPGRRLGGFSRQPPLPLLRQNALAAAESRARRGALLPSGPRHIGGDSSIMSALSPIQAAAMAAERRLLDEVWCGSKSSNSEGPSESSAFPEDRSAQASDIRSITSPEATVSSTMWQCSSCTLLNQPLALVCEACGMQKHGGQGVKSNGWSCKFCTLSNSIGAERCLACGEWRYSYGPPVSTRGPYVGT